MGLAAGSSSQAGLPAVMDTLSQSNSIFFSSRAPFSYIFTRTVQIQKTCLTFTQKPRENGVEGPFSTDSLDADRSKLNSI